nr:nipped-B-like protein [Lepeophtheirus salmonis]
MESNLYQRFNKTVELIFDNMEEINLQDLDASQDDLELPPEILIQKYQLQDLASETARLKNLGAMDSVPPERLVKLLTILEINIRDGARVCPIPSEDEEEDILWQELANERVNRAADASLTALHILTSRNMNKRVYIDDVIERLAIFLRFQLSNTIYPSYDPVYKEISKKNYTYLGSMKRIRNSAHVVRDKNILGLYNKVLEMITMLADLVKIQLLTDTTVLHISTVAVAPFFVEGIPQLQLSALKLLDYLHPRGIFDPTDLTPLITFKCSLHSFFNLFSASLFSPKKLALTTEKNKKLVPDHAKNSDNSNIDDDFDSSMDRDVLIENRYEMAMATAHQFLTVFLMKCGSKNEEIDYRPIFENFVQDLLTTVNTPEWPAAELLLSFLGHVLRDKFKNRSTELSLRLSSLDYLGVVAARLRRDAVQSKLKVDIIDSIINIIKKEEEKDDSSGESLDSMSNELVHEDPEEIRVSFLRRVLLNYLAVQGGDDDQAIMNARTFYICQWYRDINAEGKKPKPSPVKKKKKKRSSESSGEDEESDVSEPEPVEEDETDTKKSELYRQKVKRKDFLVEKILPFGINEKTKVLSTHIDPPSAHLIVKYLSSKRPFFNSFDSYLQDIINVLFEQSTQVRTRALKCMALIVQEDPNVLLRADMQKWVHYSFTDSSTMVREAAVDLVGKFILHKRDLIEQYYPMISQRILDTGVSVRKRVIKILKDICLQFPDYNMIPEICGKMIRRINDEEGIRKLVMEVFQNMWFQPIKERNRTPEEEKLLITRAQNITDVVVACRDTGLEWFEQLLQTLFKPPQDKEDVTKKVVEAPKHLVLACQQIVDCIIESVLQMEEGQNNEDSLNTSGSPSPSNRIVACLNTLYLFAKIRPTLLVEHVQILQPYLSITCKTKNDYLTIVHVARTMELVVPLIKHPSEVFLSQLEEDSVKLVIEHNIPACVSCLGSIVNNVTKNYGLIRDCFVKYCNKMSIYRRAHENDPLDLRLKKSMPIFLRGLFTVGLFLRHFDFSNPDIYTGLTGGKDTVDEVFETMFYFMRHESTDIQTATLQALGNLCVRHFNFMLTTKLKNLYVDILKEDFYDTKHKVVILNNLENYLCEEENRMISQDKHWLENCKKENLKEMRDVTSGMASTVIQVYLKYILNSVIHPALEARRAALRVIGLVLAQGLVNPVQIVPYLICMSTDPATAVSHTADRELQDIGKKYPTFIYTKLFQGIKLSHKLQMTIRKDGEVVRGFREKEGEVPTALHGFMYSIMKTTKVQRRALLNNLLKQFDDYSNETSLAQRLYLADNLAYIPYTVVDEPLFVIHHIQIMVSVIGSNMLQSFKESLKYPTDCETKMNPETGKYEHLYDEDLDDDFNSVLSRLPDDPSVSLDCIRSSQGCMLLLVLKDHLKEFYGITESRISQYSPTDISKVNERQVNRRSNVRFNPKATIEIIAKGDVNRELTEDNKKEIVKKYFQFKDLMNRIDRDDEEDDESKNPNNSLTSTSRYSNHNKPITPTSTPTKGSKRDHDEFVPPMDYPHQQETIAQNSQGTSDRQTRTSSSSTSSHRSSSSTRSNASNNNDSSRKVLDPQTGEMVPYSNFSNDDPTSSDNNEKKSNPVPKITINLGQRLSSTSSSSSRDRHRQSSSSSNSSSSHRSHRHHSSSSHHQTPHRQSSSSSHKHHKKKKNERNAQMKIPLTLIILKEPQNQAKLNIRDTFITYFYKTLFVCFSPSLFL